MHHLLLQLALLSGVVPAVALKRVLITGAGGRTGRLVFSQLKAGGAFAPIGLARSAKAVEALKAVGAADNELVVGDVADEAALESSMAGVHAVILCTSAVPRIKKLSLAKTIAASLIGKVFKSVKPGRPSFRFGKGGTPEEVDWLAAKKQIDAAVAAGVERFVFVSSMGGTDPSNFLNTIGRRRDGSGGDILLWKRKAECYLVSSGLAFTIVHPGGLVDGEPGKRELTVGVDDEMMKLASRSVARADVARVCCAALSSDAAKNLAFDLASKPAGEGAPTEDASSVFGKVAYSYDFCGVVEDPPSIFKEK